MFLQVRSQLHKLIDLTLYQLIKYNDNLCIRIIETDTLSFSHKVMFLVSIIEDQYSKMDKEVMKCPIKWNYQRDKLILEYSYNFFFIGDHSHAIPEHSPPKVCKFLFNYLYWMPTNVIFFVNNLKQTLNHRLRIIEIHFVC